MNAFISTIVPEVWRYDGRQLLVRQLSSGGVHVDSSASRFLPELPLVPFAQFVQRMVDGDETAVMNDFRQWMRALPR